MNGPEVLRIVDAIHRDKNIAQEIVFEGIELAIVSAARKHFAEEQEIACDIDRETGEPSLKCDGELLDSELLGDLLGRISAQTAKQVMIQKIREAERDSLYDEYQELRGQMVSGSITRMERGSAIVNLGKVEAFLPRSEQIPREVHRTGERIRAVVMEVRKTGSRVKIILSRAHPEFVRRLFEVEIPEVTDRIIEVRSLARESGHRSKVAVASYDNKIDCVGACVGVRGARIKNIVDELAGERIDIVRWNDSLDILVPNALQPAEVEDVVLCPMLGKVIGLVRDEQLSLAIGKKGQNVRLASKLVGWDIHVMTQDMLAEQLDKSVAAFSKVDGISDELADALVSQGFFTFDDLSVIEPDQLAELGGLTPEQCDAIIEFADEESLRLEREEKRAREEHRRAEAAGLTQKPAAKAEPKVEAAPATEEVTPETVEGDSEATDSAEPASSEGAGTAAEAVEPAAEVGEDAETSTAEEEVKTAETTE
ncbi:MAG: transcription termination factor NusA [Planctomycetaceae bacterium]